jgi:CBS domain-containing protein
VSGVPIEGAEPSLDTPLGRLPLKASVGVPPHTPLAQALARMHEHGIGSVLVSDDSGAALGILTRHDVLGRVTLARLSLDTPIAQVMSAPVHALGIDATAHDAALLMARHALRHVPVTQGGRVVGLVSERDLFALQRVSLKTVGTTIRSASDIAALAAAAQDVRALALDLHAQGVGARALTRLASQFNDQLTARLVQLVAADTGMDLQRACWLAFGSEGRGEQTIATDQDNGLVFESDNAAADRPRWLAFARRVNDALDRCGYPLCPGNVMAGNPACCLTATEWSERFVRWMEHGAPADLLNASIYFDLRALAGRTDLAEPLRALITKRAAGLPRFIKQMADNALARRVPLNWRGAVQTHELDGRDVLDLKLEGTAIFVDTARLYALAHGVAHTGTRERFDALGPLLRVPAHESQAWAAAFDVLQMLRLRVQTAQPGAALGHCNLVEPHSLNDIDRRMLEESLRVARRLQQKIALDHPG